MRDPPGLLIGTRPFPPRLSSVPLSIAGETSTSDEKAAIIMRVRFGRYYFCSISRLLLPTLLMAVCLFKKTLLDALCTVI